MTYIASIAPTHTTKTVINVMNSPLRGFIGSGSRDGCATIPRVSAPGLFFGDLELAV